jgi:hypothetical protein
MGKNFEKFTLILYILNVGISITTGNWVAVMGWTCAFIAQLRLINLID